ncbi:hypothetical protein JCGZ_01139 [Jatropha curcas]|uniref:Uncharacterized protein n=1 Tax=Jatropha curcas TaxID=180498 RepID=A0A067KTB4_JATCU|nr:hypothetical protein JCGZ_01139 [Jatropha curcas]
MACEISTVSFRLQALFLFLGFLFLVVPLLGRPISDFPKKSMASASPNSTELHTPDASTTRISGSGGASSSGEEFKAAAHEVPSGPNPESN